MNLKMAQKGKIRLIIAKANIIIACKTELTFNK